MAISTDDRIALDELDARLRIVLPEEYQDSYESVQPVSMGSAGLKFADDGRVAWDEMWGSFCDLAMAGGPPHRGALLEAAGADDVEADKDGYRRVVDEIGRGISLVTALPLLPASDARPGWIALRCRSIGMA